jgi:hypothetical protein
MFLNAFMPKDKGVFDTFKNIKGNKSSSSTFIATNNSLMRFRRVQENSVRGNLIKYSLGIVATISGQKHLLPILGSIPSNYIWAGVQSLYRASNMMFQRTVGVVTGLFMTSNNHEKLSIDYIGEPSRVLLPPVSRVEEVGAGVGWDLADLIQPSSFYSILEPFKELIEDEVLIEAESSALNGIFSVLGNICSPLCTIAELALVCMTLASFYCGNYIGLKGVVYDAENQSYDINYSNIEGLVEDLGGAIPTLSLLCAGSATSVILLILYLYRYKTKDYALTKTQNDNEVLVNLIKDLQKSENNQIKTIIEKASVKYSELKANNIKLDLLNSSLSEELANLKLIAATIIT